MMRFKWVAAFLFFCLPALAAQTPSTANDSDFLKLPSFDVASPSPSGPDHKIRVGDVLELKVEGITVPGVMKLAGDLTDEGWAIIKGRQGASLSPGDPREFNFSVSPIKSGALTLPSLALEDAQGKAIGRTNPITVQVESAIRPDDPKPTEPAAPLPPVGLRIPTWVWIASVALFLAIIGLLVYSFQRWRNRVKPLKKIAGSTEPPLPEDAAALIALAALQRKGPIKSGEFKSHYFKVSEILKNYIGARYRFDALESTTHELIGVLEEKKAVSDPIVDQLESLFEKLDLVKFTDHLPLPGEALEVVEEAKVFVTATRRPPVEKTS